MDQPLITRIVEAALLAANQPLTLMQLNALFSLDEPAPDGSIERAIEALREQSSSRGIELVEVASGFRFQVQADVHTWVARLWNERQNKYTRATLETLALIAYRQPITRGEIEQIRGVSVNSNIIKALEEREWIRVVGHRDMPGKPELLGTTKGFLDYFGLKRLDELPPLSELKDFGALEPELQFEDGPIVLDNISDLGREPDHAAGADTADAEAAGDGGDDEPQAGQHAAEHEPQATPSQTPAETAVEPAQPEQDSLREKRADSDAGIVSDDQGIDHGADDIEDRNNDNHSDAGNASEAGDDTRNEPPPALADEGDSTGAKHE